MKRKITRFFRNLINLLNILKIIRKGFRIIIIYSIKYLFGKQWGRDLIYSAFPKNELLIGNTKEGLHYVINSSDDTIGRIVFRSRKSFDSHHLVTSLKILNLKKKILLDVGANIGTVGLFAVNQGLVSKCIAFEPDPTNFQLLKTNVQINNLTNKFELHNVALASDKVGPLLLELSPKNFGDHRVRLNNSPGLSGEEKRKVISVETNSLDLVCAKINLDECILSMDTQGFEGDILSGASSLIDASVPIITEFYPYCLKRTNGLNKFYSALSKSKYTIFYDLRNPTISIDFSIDAIKKIANELGTDGAFTDLLFIK
ncbi:FkbM family methyltransferase [Candidatus Pelagibacter sp.]|nr:FkbM family methyltransferase [Candidatus Pelagibacter sp.]